MRRRPPGTAIVAAATLAMMLGACGVDSGVIATRADQLPPVSAPPTTDEPVTTTEPDETAPDETAPSTTGPVVSGDIELADVADIGDGKEPRDYDDTVAAALVDLEEWWTETYPQLYGDAFTPLTGDVYPTYPGRDDVPDCGGTPTDYPAVNEYAAFYCALDDFIVYDDGDSSLLGELAERYGPATMGVVIAHEYGHLIQQRNGSINEELATIYTEQQADCWAGAWVGRAWRGESPVLQLDDDDVRGGLIAMVTVRDPVGLSQFAEGGHGSAFDRVGAFQVGFSEGPARCAELLDDPLTILPNQFQTVDEALNDGDAPFGFADGDIGPLIAGALQRYWTFELGQLGQTFPGLRLAPVDDLGQVDCSGSVSPALPGLLICDSDRTVYVDQAVARALYDDPIEGNADFAVAYLVATGWADAVQTQLGSVLTGEERALANDCLVGAFTRDLDPNRPARPDEPENRGFISPGDLDEAVITAITIGDARFDDDVLGSGYEKIASFRDGVLAGVDTCIDRLGG
ncbi:MAG TPA: hypothetical protein VGK49_05115 [Ilumatobacteraceae bacterium]